MESTAIKKAGPFRTCLQTIRSHLKNRILVQGLGGTAFQTAGILEYFEDLKRGTNKNIGPIRLRRI
jgi:hypothetical protein